MKQIIDSKLCALVEDKLEVIIERELNDEALASINTRDLTILIVSNLIQIMSQPFIADVYQSFKEAIHPKIENVGLNLTREDMKEIFDKSFEVFVSEGELDESWKAFKPYE